MTRNMQNGKISDLASGFGHIWRTKPNPCEAQLELNHLFENGEIDRTMTPETIRARYPLFQSYSAKVFASHFRSTKAIYGLSSKAEYFKIYQNIL